MVLAGKGLQIVISSVIQRLSGYQCAVASLLLGGFGGIPVVKFPCFMWIIVFFICTELKIVTSV